MIVVSLSSNETLPRDRILLGPVVHSIVFHSPGKCKSMLHLLFRSYISCTRRLRRRTCTGRSTGSKQDTLVSGEMSSMRGLLKVRPREIASVHSGHDVPLAFSSRFLTTIIVAKEVRDTRHFNHRK